MSMWLDYLKAKFDHFLGDYEWCPIWPHMIRRECIRVEKYHPETVEIPPEIAKIFKPTPGHDPRFQQQNQTIRCYVMYTDFHRCEKILGKNNNACTWFKDVYKVVCPNEWIEKFDNQRAKNPPTFPWHKGRSQGHFPGHSYGNNKRN